MLKKKWIVATSTMVPFDTNTLKNAEKLSDVEGKIRLEEGGYTFSKKFQSRADYIHRCIADNDVLISNENMASFNGYIELSPSTAFLWDEIKEPRASSELERALEDQFNLPHEKAVENVLVFLKEFRENGIVTALGRGSLVSGDLQKAEYRTNPNYLIRKVMDQYLLVAVGSTEVMQNKLMTLNETGRFIWDNLQDFLTLEELTDRAKKQFIDKDGTLEQEICDFVKVLVKLGLIEERS